LMLEVATSSSTTESNQFSAVLGSFPPI
jgi:hypothetical protein